MLSNFASASVKLVQLALLVAFAAPVAGALVVVDGGETTLKPGDRIAGLIQGDVQTALAGPLQFYAAAIRRGASADVVFYGERDSSDQRWAIPSSRWDITVAPEIQDKDLEAELVQWLAAEEGQNDAGLLSQLTDAWTAEENWHDLAWLFVNRARKQATAGNWGEASSAVAGAEQTALPNLDPELRAVAWSRLAAVFERNPDPELARSYYQRAVNLWESAPVLRAFGLERLGGFNARHGKLDGASGQLDEALDLLASKAPTSLIAVRAWNGKGTVAYAGGDYPKAISHYQQALDLLERRGGPEDEKASPLGNLGTLAAVQGDLSKAQQLYDAALRIKQRKPEDPVIPRLLNNLGIIAKQRGDLLAAERYYQQALDINRERQAWVSYSTNLFNLADLASDQGDLEGASQLLGQALAHFQQQNARSPAVAQTLAELAGIELQLDHVDRSTELYREAAALYEEVAPDSIDYALVLEGQGDVAARKGDLHSAAELYERALAWREPISPQSIHLARTKVALAEIRSRAGNPKAARALIDDALALQRAVAPGSIDEAQSLFTLASLQTQANELTDAVKSYEAGIAMVEYQTQRLGGADDSRSRFNDKYSRYFKQYMTQLLALSRFEQAFDVLERYRARSLLAMLAERDLNWRQDLPAPLQQERRQLDRDYDAAQSTLLELAESRASESQLRDAREVLADLKRRRDAFAAELRVSSPRFASLTYPQPLKLDEVQRQLPVDTVVLSYSVHESSSWVFVVTAESLRVIPLGLNAQELSALVERFRNLIALGQYEAQVSPAFVELGGELFDLLLRPALNEISENRLLLVPDGALHLLPFAALVDSQTSSDRSGNPWRYVAEISPLSSVLSLTLYDFLSTQQSKSPASQDELRLVAFGDPALDNPHQVQPANLVTRTGTNLSNLPPLPGARAEVEALAALYQPKVRTYVGASATEAAAKSVSGRVQYLHFATHSVLNQAMPLDSGLVLSASQAPDSVTENGLLQTWEILEDLRVDTDLVVLSGCETNLGTDFGGEGMVGLTRAFHHAGSKAVMASLWQIADRSAADVVRLFHSYRLSGASADAALQRAQLEFIAREKEGWFTRVWRSMKERPAFSHPFHWAALQLHGADL